MPGDMMPGNMFPNKIPKIAKPEAVVAEPATPIRMSDTQASEIINSKVAIDEVLNELNKIAPNVLFAKNRLTLESVARLVLELREKFDNYDTIISDDTSGRLLSLFFKELIDKRKKEIEKPPVEIYFVATSANAGGTTPALESFIGKKQKTLGKTLVLTEYISSGQTMEIVTDILERHGVDFDIAAVSLTREAETYEHGAWRMLKHLIYGKESSSVGISFHDKPTYAGVQKGEKTSLHPRLTNHSSDESREHVKLARQQLKRAAELLAPLLD